jgi:16S rRNA (adenine(1408)-N(1))-methyltransferase
MHQIRGRRARAIDAREIAAWAANYGDVVLDLGTGDGRFVAHLARQDPARAVIGVDSCRDNLRRISRAAPENACFVVADALALPGEWDGLARVVTINYAWGSLLRGLLAGHAGLLAGLRAVGSGGLALEVTLNAEALAAAGWEFERGAKRVADVLRTAGFAVCRTSPLTPDQLRAQPTTWAKRLAFGRDPRAVSIEARLTQAGQRR